VAAAHPIILFDGLCRLCNGSVNFLIDHDPAAHFRFAPLQSRLGRDLLSRFDLDAGLGSVVLVENGRAYQRSDAALRLARGLGGLWGLLSWAVVIPRPVRDAIYDLIARNRYRWFGKSQTCRMPTPGLTNRFLA
jgi:predicted DCC family thiol-disulfide oxidoreductase YuxK